MPKLEGRAVRHLLNAVQVSRVMIMYVHTTSVPSQGVFRETVQIPVRMKKKKNQLLKMGALILSKPAIHNLLLEDPDPPDIIEMDIIHRLDPMVLQVIVIIAIAARIVPVVGRR